MEEVLRAACPYIIAICSQPEVAGDVISGLTVSHHVVNPLVNFQRSGLGIFKKNSHELTAKGEGADVNDNIRRKCFVYRLIKRLHYTR